MGIIVSPADGRVLYVRKIENDTFIWYKEKKIPLKEIVWADDIKVHSGYIIGVYMSPFDVHVNRSPISGKVIKTTHFKGKFLRMRKKESELLNERNFIVLEHEKGFRTIVIQIAAFAVGKIDCYVKENMGVKLGQRIGRVRLGSQVDIIICGLPELKILKKPGEKVLAGETVIAEYTL